MIPHFKVLLIEEILCSAPHKQLRQRFSGGFQLFGEGKKVIVAAGNRSRIPEDAPPERLVPYMAFGIYDVHNVQSTGKGRSRREGVAGTESQFEGAVAAMESPAAKVSSRRSDIPRKKERQISGSSWEMYSQ